MRAGTKAAAKYNLSVSLRSTAPLVGEPLAKRESFAECQSLPYKGRWHEVPERLDEGGPEEYFCAFWLAKKRSSE